MHRQLAHSDLQGHAMQSMQLALANRELRVSS